jgi:type II secretory ATPase GspE/PulE/Tfp pilus assembly ATPase PilB-like protein
MICMTPPIRDALISGANRDALHTIATLSGDYQPLLHDGVAKVIAGISTLDEVRRVATAF